MSKTEWVLKVLATRKRIGMRETGIAMAQVLRQGVKRGVGKKAGEDGLRSVMEVVPKWYWGQGMTEIAGLRRGAEAERIAKIGELWRTPKKGEEANFVKEKIEDIKEIDSRRED